MMEVFTIQKTKGKNGQEGKDYWTKVGNAFTNKDGSMNVYLTALPLDGKLQLRERKEKDAKD